MAGTYYVEPQYIYISTVFVLLFCFPRSTAVYFSVLGNTTSWFIYFLLFISFVLCPLIYMSFWRGHAYYCRLGTTAVGHERAAGLSWQMQMHHLPVVECEIWLYFSTCWCVHENTTPSINSFLVDEYWIFIDRRVTELPIVVLCFLALLFCFACHISGGERHLIEVYI